ncbi:protein sprint isoform X1 [Nymphalis io]|uniref:protein sprint isoform X1 n=2 Tax=Inachis io TaxID=171585 RepID=UPI0021698498|nr:protein sprint isoform X1 [Nymphalis io]XP_050343967.1 protein sprint isoform X1 [Nymphalis io]
MSIDQASPLVPIKPQIALQNSAFIKNSHNRSSFCGVTPSPTNGNRTFKTFSVNRKSWSGNVTLPLQQYALDEPAPKLGTFRSGTGTFPRNRERNNNSASNGILTPNGNSVQTLKGNEVRRSGCSNGRRYAEIGNWSKRNATFLEPHLQGVRRRDSRSSDSEHDERSTEDDERSLIRSSPRTRLPPPPPPPPDDEPPPMKPREFFERLQSQAMKEAQDRKQKRELKESNHLFRPLDAEGSLGDSLSQSRESLSSDGEGAKGDCSSVGSSGSESEEQPPCDIGLLERLIRTHPVWFLPGIQRAGAFHLLQGKEEGNFVVRQSSQPDTMAISVRLPADKGPYIEHYLIQASSGRIGLETSHNRFDNIPELIAHYSQCCDELPVQLQLPRPLREAKSRHQLSSLALLGQEFWGYPMANPKNNPNNLLSPSQLPNGSIPMAVTPSDTGSSLSSFNANTVANSREQILSPDKDQNVVLKMSPVDTSGSPPSQSQSLSTFKGRTAPSPPAKPTGTFVRAPRPTPPNTLNLISSTAHITHPHTFPTTTAPHSPTHSNNIKMTPPPPPPRWAKPPFPKISLSPKSEAFSPINKASSGNIIVTTTVTFSVNNTQIHNHQINESIQSDRLQLTLASNSLNNNSSDAVFSIMDGAKSLTESNGELQNMMHRLTPEGECISTMSASLHGSFKRQIIEQNSTEAGSPLESQSQTNTSESVDPIANTLTKSSIPFHSNQLVSPNGTNSVTSGIFSPTSQINSPVSNDTISSKSGIFSPISQTNKSEVFSPISRSSPLSNKNVFSPTSNNSITSPMTGKDREKVLTPTTNTTSTTPSGRSRRSKHSMRKESRHYQESDILESPGVYYRSSLMDKVSDYEDIWGPESNNCSTFKPLKSENDNNNVNSGIMKSKRPDLLPDTLPKLNAAKSTQSILEKENMILLNSVESLNEKRNLSDNSLKKSFNGSNEIIATTNSKGDVVAKRPDKLNIVMNMNKKLTEEIEATLKIRENHNIESMETVKIEDDFIKRDDSEKEHAGSPFYADPVDAIKEAALLPVQRRKLLRSGVNLSQRYSEPPSQNHPYYPLRDMHSIEELSPSSPNTSTSVDNLVSLRSKPKMKAVEPPRVAAKPPSGRNEHTWAVDSSWQFINKNDECSNSESGTFPSLVEQESRLSGVDDGVQHLTVHQVVAQRFPELRLNAEPAALPEEVRSPPRASCYDNVHDLRPLSEQASDDGTVFSEPWDSSQWDGLIPPTNVQQSYEADEPCEWESPIPRRGPAAVTRAKSFRDRLDPLLAAGRVRALRGGRTTRGAGAALRAYALHLAQDKSTTFAQNVDNFIACTLDSKETCPQIMMRNMRQFMSGMKNYLVKHGEREFEKEVEKERLKLKPNEFLNLDAILEGVMHRLVVRPLRSKLYTLLASWHSADVRQLHSAIERAQHATPLQLGIKESTKIPSSAVLAIISKHFLKMQEADSPLDKLENLLAAISVMFNAIRGERTLGADDLLPVLAWTVARCRLVCAELEAELMAGLLPAALLAGEGGYYLTALFSAVAVLKRLAPDTGPDSTTPWRRGSAESAREGCGVAVVRVALPDECRGSIRRVALPCRPGARARDLCRALAHAAHITNPQDYALFALHDGQETMLNENDCPQEVMSEKSGQNFILAYKRIDAKIAWPQQALLSYP